MTIQRIAMSVRYDGSAYHGWQTQDALDTVQERIEKSLSLVADHPVSIVCAGRTDAGVHAANQVIHFDTEADRSDYAWIFGANSNLPNDISVDWAHRVDENFHARFSAKERRYRYIFYNYAVRPAILRHAVTWHHRPLDEALMQEAANHLLGEHDFSSFRGANCQAVSPIREIREFTVTRHNQLLMLDLKGDGFLHHMVRNIAGVLLPIGAGLKDPDWAKEVLDAVDRTQAGVTAPPNGLYLIDVQYPKKFNLPTKPLGPFFLQAII